MEHSSSANAASAARNGPAAQLAQFQTPILHRSVFQLALNVAGYTGLVAAMYAISFVSPWLSLALAIPAAGFVVRLFIIQHDCGHGSFFRGRLWNSLTGSLCSVMTFTPYADWRRQHAGHHAVWNNLDARHSGADIYSGCLTLAEYQALTPRARLMHRVLHHPLMAQLVLPPFIFLALYRIPFDTPAAWHRERRSVYWTNAMLLTKITGLILIFGIWKVLLVQLPIIVTASIIGVWLFSVQHRFEDSQWTREADWSPTAASLHGCSWLRLPRILQWFTGNIGFHHIHHLLPRIPNYRLQAAHESLAPARVTTLTLRDAFRAPGYALWDEAAGRMVRFPKG
jgi:omega-6 fatty acid desaturase (delta-12 desaturase)